MIQNVAPIFIVDCIFYEYFLNGKVTQIYIFLHSLIIVVSVEHDGCSSQATQVKQIISYTLKPMLRSYNTIL